MTETATDRGDRIQREAQERMRPRIETYCQLMIGACGGIARISQMGYGPHVVTRDLDLPRHLKDWLNAGCPE